MSKELIVNQTNTNFTQEALITVPEFRKLLKDMHPFAEILGIEIINIDYGVSKLRLPPNSSNQRLGGIIAGPMLMGLADLALYAAMVGATGIAECVTASLTINFLRPAPADGIIADAKILKLGRMSAGEVLLVPEHGGKPVAQVISTWSLPKGKPS